jgi:hypothetical protein
VGQISNANELRTEIDSPTISNALVDPQVTESRDFDLTEMQDVAQKVDAEPVISERKIKRPKK